MRAGKIIRSRIATAECGFGAHRQKPDLSGCRRRFELLPKLVRGLERRCRPLHGLKEFLSVYLGLTPWAVCCHLLRRFAQSIRSTVACLKRHNQNHYGKYQGRFSDKYQRPRTDHREKLTNN